jgi:two-component sensor histidine kinase
LSGTVRQSARQLKALEEEVRSAYRELAHRVKNHLQIMSSLIELDARDATLTTAELAERNQLRLKTLATIYDTMVKSEVGSKVRASEFIDALCQPYRSPSVAIQVSVEPDDLLLSSEQASHMGMLTNEAVCNSYKHAFPKGAGNVWVSLKRAGPEQIALEIADDGVGIPDTPSKSQSLGLLVMRDQAEKLRGRFEVSCRPSGGAAVNVLMPAEL